MPESPGAGRYFLALDVGSSALRASVMSATGPPLSIARRPLRYTNARGGGELALELDLVRTWRNLRAAARAARAASRIPPRAIAAVAITSQRQAVVFLDASLNVVLATPNRDMRGVFQGAALDESIGDLVHDTTGHLPSSMLAWSKLAWLREEAPDRSDRVRYVCTLADWIALQLTGELAVERTAGVEAGLVSVRDGSPAAALRDACRCEDVAIPPLIGPAAAVGGLHADGARQTGLPAGTPVAPAGPDSQAALIGMGAYDPGDTGVVAGWSGAVQRVTRTPVFDPERGLWTGRHVAPDRWVLEGNAGIMGGAYQWLAETLRPLGDPAASLLALDRSASRGQPGAGGLTAHLGPALVNMSRPTLRAGGFVFPVPLALSPPAPGDFGRAAVEGFAFAVRANVDRLSEVTGESARIAVGGGMARSRAFIVALAATLGRETFVGRGEESLRGAATVAAAALAGDGSLEVFARARARGLRTVRPRAALAAQYAGLYEAWGERTGALEQAAL